MTSLPTLFVSHGAPTFALEPGLAGARLAALGRQLPRPQAVLVVSPHWMTRQPQATLSLRPETIHDFGGFDPALYTCNTRPRAPTSSRVVRSNCFRRRGCPPAPTPTAASTMAPGCR